MPAPKTSPRWRQAPLILALLCALAAYSNSFRGPFIFDDIDAIQNNPQINRTLRPTGQIIPTTLSGRPVLALTFAADEAIAGMHVEIYHATNLLIHFACGSLLFGIIRRNLASNFWNGRFQNSAPWLAGAITALWLVHPLNTQAVTYIVERAESLAALFYLAVIYAVIRDAESPRLGWKLTAIFSCALGMASKETMATAPLVALLYDRTFLSGSFAAALTKRVQLYAGLAATWTLLAAIILSGARSSSVGFNQNISPLQYAATQLGVIAHYLFLAVWPQKLVLDYYDWPLAGNWLQIETTSWLVLLAIVFFAAAFWLKRWLGFLGAWFFIILAPSSSFVPIFTEIAAEQRMYLPLIAIIALIVVGGWTLLNRGQVTRFAAAVLFIAALAGLSARTFARNTEYQSPEKIWADNAAERPMNPRAHFNLGYSLLAQGKPAAAAAEFRTALDLASDYYAAARELGRALQQSGRTREAENFYTREIRKFPAFAPEAHAERGRLRASRGDLAGAQADFQAATRPAATRPAANAR